MHGWSVGAGGVGERGVISIRCAGGCGTFVSLQSELPPLDSGLPFPAGTESYGRDV